MGSDSMENGETALYLFCFARSDAVREVRSTAVDGHSRLLVLRPSPDLCAVVSEVAREDFCGPAAELPSLQLDWVAPRAVRHEAVMEEVMAYSPILPLPFGTLFSVRLWTDTAGFWSFVLLPICALSSVKSHGRISVDRRQSSTCSNWTGWRRAPCVTRQ